MIAVEMEDLSRGAWKADAVCLIDGCIFSHQVHPRGGRSDLGHDASCSKLIAPCGILDEGRNGL